MAAISLAAILHMERSMSSVTLPICRRIVRGIGSSVRQLDDQPVLAGLDARRQYGAELAVVECLIHMGQDGAPRAYPGNPGQRLFEMAVRRVRPAARAVDDPQLDAGDCRK